MLSLYTGVRQLHRAMSCEFLILVIYQELIMLNTLGPDEAFMILWIRSSLVQVMADGKPWCEPVLTRGQLDIWKKYFSDI